MVLLAGLDAAPPQRAGPLSRLFAPLRPLLLLAILFLAGLPRATLSQLLSLDPRRWIDPWAWRDALLANGMPTVLALSDSMSRPIKAGLIAPNARGHVLEVGAGSGETIKFYDAEKVESLTLVEPFEALLPLLRQAIRKRGPEFEAKCTVVPHGIEDRAALGSLGERGFDTVVLVQVLCSIPEPQRLVPKIVSLLRPGGRLVYFEHVASRHATTRSLQTVASRGFWTWATNGCCLDRDSSKSLLSSAEWSESEVLRVRGEHDAEMVPHEAGVFVKKA